MGNIIFYKTTADFDNTGEVLIYKSLLELLRNYGNVFVDNSSKISPLFLERIGVTEYEKISTVSTFSFNTSLFIFAIKNIFSSNKIYLVTGVGDHKIIGKKSILKNYISIIILLLFSLLKGRVLRIGMSITFGGKYERISERILSTFIHSYNVRDSISLHNCHQAKIMKCKQAPDLSWAYSVKIENKTRPYITLNFRNYADEKKDSKEYKKELLKKISVIIKLIKEKFPEKKIILLHQVNLDLDFMKEIKKTFAESTTLIEELITLDNAEKYYGKSEFVFSNRLHVLLLAYKFGALSIGVTNINKHLKIKGIFADIGLSKLLVDITNNDSEFKKETEHICDNKDSFLQKFYLIEEQNKAKLKEDTNTFFNGTHKKHT